MDPSVAKTWTVGGEFEYRVRAVVHRKSCDDQAIATHVGKATTAAAKAAIKLSYDAKTRLFALTNP